jgi:hypothetical protein
MMPPFDIRFHDPVAQGMITDKPHDYHPTYFSLWAVLEVFLGLTGAYLTFFKKYGLWFFYTVFFLIPCLLLYAYAHEVPSYSLGGKIVYGLFVTVFTVIGFIPHMSFWLTKAKRILSEPEKLFSATTTHGLFVESELLDTLNPYAEGVKKMMPSSALFESYDGKTMRNMFAIRMNNEKDADNCKKSTGDPITTTLEILGAVLASPFAGLVGAIANMFKFFFNRGEAPAAGVQTGGAAADPLSTESLVLGGTLIALILGGVMKGTVDHLTKAA